MRMTGFLLLVLIFLIFLISCTDKGKDAPIYSIPSDQKPVIQVSEKKLVNPCDSVVCAENQSCDNGVCSCKPDFRPCGGDCISSSSCCSSSDCSQREICKDNICEQVKYCDFNQVWNEKTKDCECIKNHYWCQAQNSCIPFGNCCSTRECNSLGQIKELCMPSQPQIYVCIKSDKGSHCSFMPEGKRSSFSTIDAYGDVFVNNVFENGVSNFNILINNNNYSLANVKMGETVVFGGGYVLRTEKTAIKGGFCTD